VKNNLPQIVAPTRKAIRRGVLSNLAALSVLATSGCDRAPSYSILGSFFPVWIFCFVVGLLLTLLVHVLLQRLKLADQLVPAVLVYPSLTALFTMSLWLIFYS
jgi:hypothetical protein